MASEHLTTGLRALFPTTEISQASRTASGAREVQRREPVAIDGGNYLPLLVLAAAGALLMYAMLKPTPAVGGFRESAAVPQNQEWDEESSEENWQTD